MQESVPPRGDFWAGRWLLLLGASFYLLTTSGERPSGDGALLFSVAEHIVDDGSICAGDVRAGNTYLLEDGCRVTDYGLGTSLTLVPGVVLLRAVEALGLTEGPAYEPVRALLTHLAPALIGGLSWWMLFVLAARLSGSRRRAFWLTVVTGLTTTLWFYHRTALSEGVQTFGLLACVVALHAYRTRGQAVGTLVAAGAAFGLAVTTKGVLWVMAPALAAYLAWGLGRKALRPLLVFAATLGPFVILQLWFNHVRFGDILDFGYHTFRDGELGFSHPLGAAVWGYLVSPSKSFFLYNPVALAALWAWRRFWRRHPPEAALFLCIAALTVYLFGRWWSWHGDWSWGPRFLVVLVPFLSLPAAFLFPAGLTSRAARVSVASACLVALWIQFLGCFVPVWRYLAVAFDSTQASFPPYGGRLAGHAHRPMDDQLPVHHIPHFSPILGHWWLFKHLIMNDPDFSRDHPWRSLGIDAWTPRRIGLDYGLDWWGGGRNPPLGLVLALTILLIGATAESARRAIRCRDGPVASGAPGS